MNERDTFDRILASLHEAALDDARWPETSAVIDDAFRAKGNSLVFGDGGSDEGVQIFYAGFFYHGQRHREHEREYFDDFHARDNASRASGNCPAASWSTSETSTPTRS